MTTTRQSILITGGAGFIGSHLVDVLLEKDHRICVLDNLSYGKREFLPPNDSNLQFVQGDILDLELLMQIFSDCQPTLIYHLAAIHHIPTCEENPSLALRVNVEGTQSVLTAASNIRSVERFVFASTGAIYDVTGAPLAEDSPIVPTNVYGVSKVTGEHLVRINAQRTGIQTVAARIFNAVGPRETNAHLVPDILIQVHRGEREIRLGNLEPRRSYIHVKDIAEGLYTLGTAALEMTYEVFNIGDDSEYSVKEVLHVVSEVLGHPLVAVQTKERMRESDKLSQRADIQKAWQQIGWRSRRTLRSAIKDALDEAVL